MAELLKVAGVNDKKALQKLLDKRDEELHLKLQRTKGYAELVRMKAAANLLLQAVHADMDKLVQRHDAATDTSAVVYGVSRDVDAAGLDYRHLPILMEEAFDYAKVYVNLRKHAETRVKKKSEDAERERLSFAVDCGLGSPVTRSVPMFLFGTAKAIRLAVAHAVGTVVDQGRARVVHLTTGVASSSPNAVALPANEWVGKYNDFHRLIGDDTDLLVCDDALNATKSNYKHEHGDPDPAPDRVARVARRLRGMTRSRNVAMLVCVPIAKGDSVANYTAVSEVTYAYTVDVEGASLVVQDLSCTKKTVIPIRRAGG